MDLAYKQYLITNYQQCRPTMIEYPISSGIYLYLGKDLSFYKGITRGGIHFFLLGDAYCTEDYPQKVEDSLDCAVGDDIFAISRNWTGRWVLILGEDLITDASGLMSAFYHEDEKGWLVSSSIALLSDLLGGDEGKEVSTSGLTWKLLPFTIHDQVRSLFCTQKMTLTNRLRIVFYNRFAEWEDLTYEQRVSTITSSLVNCLKNIEQYSRRKIWLALTAGKDSRLTFAAALASGAHFETYTACHRNLSDADRHLPVSMSKQYGITHHMLQPEAFSKQRFDDYCVFTGHNSLGADAEFYASGQFDQIPIDVISIKSGLFEIGQTYARRIAGGNEKSFIKGIKNYYKSSFKDKKQVEAFYEWLEYQRENPMPCVDIRDRFYLEQRLNGWAAAIEQSLTINPFLTIQIANSSIVLGCLLYASAKEREGLRLSYDLIRNLNEKLLDYPVNQKTIGDTARIVLNGIKRRLHL